MTPEDRASQRRQIARLGGLTTAMRHNAREYTQAARDAFNARWYKDIPTDLPQEERDRRAEAARRLHFAKLGLKSAEARRSRKK